MWLSTVVVPDSADCQRLHWPWSQVVHQQLLDSQILKDNPKRKSRMPEMLDAGAMMGVEPKWEMLNGRLTW
jgi:hypothetical protein